MDKTKPKSSSSNHIHISGVDIQWRPKKGTCTFNKLPVAMMWVDTTLASLMKGVQSMVGTERFALALQSEGRKSVDADWTVISKSPDFNAGFKAIASFAAVAGWGRWELVSRDDELKQCTFRASDSWEALYQKSLGVCWGSAMLAGKFAGYCSVLFATNCWADQTAFAARGDEYDEFVVKPSPRSIEAEIEGLLATDEATKADMAVALRKLEDEMAERQRAEDALRESEERFRGIFDNAVEGIFQSTPEGRFLSVNPAMAQMCGYATPEEMIDNVTDIATQHYVNPPDRELLKQALSEMGHVSSWEHLMFRKDGSRIWVSLNARVVRDSLGYILHYQGTCQDITRRREAEEALKDSEERYRRLVENASDVIYETDASGYLRFINPSGQKLVGYTSDEIMGKHYLDLLPPEYHKEQSDFLRQLFLEKIPTSTYETPVVTKDGRTLWLWQSTNLILEGERVTGFRVIARDITDRKRAEADLRESEERWKFALEGSGDGVWDWDATTGRVYFSRQWKAMLGFEEHEISNNLDEWDKRIHPDDRKHVYSEINKHFEGKTPVYISEHRVMCKDGTYKWILDRGKVISRTQEGKPLRVIGTHSDLTERKRAEELIRLSEERYRELVENASDIIYETDASGNIEFLNPSAENLARATTDEILGRNYLEFLPPEYRREQARLLGIQFVKKIPTSYHETPILMMDGRVVWLWQSVNLIFEDDKVKGFRVIARDVTDRKRAEEALKETASTLRAITASAHDAIIMVDDNGNITFWNEAAEQILGWSRSETLGQDLHRLIASEAYHEASTRGIEHFRETGGGNAVGKTIELAAVRKDGTEIPIELSLSAVALSGKWHAVGIMRDITERKQAEAERVELDRRLQQAQKLESLGVLAGGIAHDFNNLLMGVLGNLDLSLFDLPHGSRPRTLIEKAMSAGRRAAELTRQMLAYSGKGSYVVGRVDLNDLVRQTEGLIRAAIPKTVSLELELTSQSALIEADSDQVKQVIMNILSNAAEAMEQQTGVITLKTAAQHCDEQCLSLSRIHEKPPAGRFVCLEVSDTGRGMDEQGLQRLFEPFYSTKFTGRGLGMSAVLGIMSTHNGAIFVDSTQGKGTLIRVMFPACEEKSTDVGLMADEVALSAGPAARKGMVLIVDDEEDIREVCSVFVEHLGFGAIIASDGIEAIDLFRKHGSEIVCVLLDLTMPRLDGVGTYKQMTGIRKDIPVILSSGFSELDISKRFTTMGLAGFIQKPYTLHELKDKITHVLRSFGRRNP